MSEEKKEFEITRKNFLREEKFGIETVGYTYQITFNRALESDDDFVKIVDALNAFKDVSGIEVIDVEEVKPTVQVDKKVLKKKVVVKK